jgi:hypothetical protein
MRKLSVITLVAGLVAAAAAAAAAIPAFGATRPSAWTTTSSARTR